MNAKAVQITLVVIAVLCAVGIFALLGSKDTGLPEGYKAPGWMFSLSDFSARPPVSRFDLREERSREPFPSRLTVREGRGKTYRVAPDTDSRARTLEFQVLQGQPQITYKPDNGEHKPQNWPEDDYPNADPKFTVDSQGGRLTISVESGAAQVRIEE
ncbi:hypothetical protein [Marinimicrobium locisalis]|uniref:hypothetical protein n=1 Tax=Marinimicrobium locisalis TaxID=546022 RepID=UPI0032214AB8